MAICNHLYRGKLGEDFGRGWRIFEIRYDDECPYWTVHEDDAQTTFGEPATRRSEPFDGGRVRDPVRIGTDVMTASSMRHPEYYSAANDA